MTTAIYRTVALRNQTGRVPIYEVTHEDGRMARFPYSDPRTLELFEAVESLWPDVDILDCDPA